jgi:hypothetical protein
VWFVPTDVTGVIGQAAEALGLRAPEPRATPKKRTGPSPVALPLERDGEKPA